MPLFIITFPIYTIAQKLQPLGLGIDSIFGLVPPYVAGSLPFNTLVFVGAMRSIPLDVEEAAILDGCSLPQMLVWITLPLVAAAHLLCHFPAAHRRRHDHDWTKRLG